jgi:hypothetical protein
VDYLLKMMKYNIKRMEEKKRKRKKGDLYVIMLSLFFLFLFFITKQGTFSTSSSQEALKQQQ